MWSIDVYKRQTITCEKESVTSKTVYKDLEGNEIKVNDGNTFIQMCPSDAKLAIE